MSEYTPDLSSLPLFADPPPVADQPPARHATPAHRYVHRERPLGAAHSIAARTPRQADVRIDWGLVRAFRQQAADQLAAALREREGLDEAARHELGRGIVLNLLSEHADEEMAAGSETFSPDEQQDFAGAIFDSLFGLGRLQPLVDHPDIENIEISGYDNVHLVYSDGRIEPGPPVADSDEELIEFLAFLASRSGGSERPFSPANPRLHLRLADGSRLAATAWITPRPSAVIRLHRLTDIDLADLVARGTMDDGLASFLAAAVRARRTVVVSGGMGAGKTTLIRALCNELDPLERIGTIETEYELHLHEMTDRHQRVVAWEARPGSGERGPDGKSVGEITLDDIVYDSLRYNLSRVIVGEVRGREVLPMFKAMQAGAGSLSTTHARSGRAAIERLVTCAMEAGPHVTEAFAYRQIAEHIDLIVQIDMDDTSTIGSAAMRRRFISEVIAVEAGEHGMPAVTDVYRPGDDGRAVPGTLPQWLKGLASSGFDIDAYTGRVA
ncbi:MAG: Flp pilus assembly complex ATPase component TadA [Actinomycetota bacterium]|nr:Flp pilus assembly complex ATPase component TadA [Actinomycetota bacterium]